MLGSMLLVSQLVIVGMISQGWIEQPAAGEALRPATASSFLASIAATSIGGLSAIGIVLLWLRLFDDDAPRKLGLTFCSEDVAVGLRASLMILPPVMLVSAGAAYFVPYQHPVLESLARVSTPAVLLASFIGTAIVTPVVEEFMARVLLQGALQRIADQGTDEEMRWTPRAFWPLVVSSLIFSALHFGQGAAPIPLFVLSLGLGYLYRQTGSIVPPLIVHMILNGLTLIVEFLNLHS
jgi:membrane protease YdiL (CAAX protease family)